MKTPDESELSLPKSRKLLTKQQYKHLFSSGQRDYLCGISIVHCKNKLDHPRLGLAIAKKQIRLAVDRNRIKRIVRESFRHEQSNLPNIDVTVLVRQRVLEDSNAQLFHNLNQLWIKLKSCYENS